MIRLDLLPRRTRDEGTGNPERVLPHVFDRAALPRSPAPRALARRLPLPTLRGADPVLQVHPMCPHRVEVGAWASVDMGLLSPRIERRGSSESRRETAPRAGMDAWSTLGSSRPEGRPTRWCGRTTSPTRSVSRSAPGCPCRRLRRPPRRGRRSDPAVCDCTRPRPAASSANRTLERPERQRSVARSPMKDRATMGPSLGRGTGSASAHVR
jgi:hypothetical protein